MITGRTVFLAWRSRANSDRKGRCSIHLGGGRSLATELTSDSFGSKAGSVVFGWNRNSAKPQRKAYIRYGFPRDCNQAISRHSQFKRIARTPPTICGARTSCSRPDRRRQRPRCFYCISDAYPRFPARIRIDRAVRHCNLVKTIKRRKGAASGFNENSPERTSRSARHAHQAADAARTPSARGRSSTGATGTIPSAAPRPRSARCG